MSTSSIVIPTRAIYSLPNLAGFNEAKKRFIQQALGDDYSSLNAEAKWDRLMESFATNISIRSRAVLLRFKDRRKRVDNDNRFVISLTNMTEFFESFYFLYGDKASQFKLTAGQKAQLLVDLNDAAQPDWCETGLYTRFHALLQKLRKDLDWITHQLHQQRQLIIQQIADEYNALHNVPESMSIHTVMHMFKLAHHQGFGVKPEREIEDVHLKVQSTRAITNYFNNASKIKFDRYQRELVPNLAQHIMFEFNKCLKETDISDLKDWDHHPIKLPIEFSATLNKLINEMLDDSLSSFEVEVENEEDSLEFTWLGDKQYCHQTIEKLIEKKLLLDGLLTSLDEVDAQSDLCLPQAVSLETLIEMRNFLAQANNTPSNFASNISNHQAVICAYPTLFISAFIEAPELWPLLPKQQQTNPIFIDTCVQALDYSLRTALAKEPSPNNADNIKKMVDCLWIISRSNTVYLEKLSATVLANKAVATQLIAKDWRLMKYLPDELRCDDVEILQIAQAQTRSDIAYIAGDKTHLLAHYDQLRHQVFSVISQHLLRLPRNDDMSSTELATLIEKAQHILELSTTEFIPASQMLRLTQHLNPRELLAVAQAHTRNFPQAPLPYCRTQTLTEFSDLVDIGLWQSNGYLEIKRTIASSTTNAQQEKYLAKGYPRQLANRSIETSNQWFLAFVKYQKQLPMYEAPLRTLDDIYHQLLLSYQSFTALLRSIGNFLAKDGCQLATAIAIYLICDVLSEALWTTFAKGVLYLNSHVGLLLPGIFQAMVLSYFLHHKFELGPLTTIASSALLLGITLAAPTIVLVILLAACFAIEAYYLAKWCFIGLMKTIGMLFGQNWTWNELSEVAYVAFHIYLLSDISLLFFTVKAGVHLVTNLFSTWPTLLGATVLPWFSRTLATFTQGHPASNEIEKLKHDIEESILRLLTKEDYVAFQKGELLKELWEQIQAEVKLAGNESKQAYTEKLHQKYHVCTSGGKKDVSFWEVASTRRSNESMFTPNAPDERFSFFGLRGKTTTASQLQRYFEEPTAPIPAMI